MTEGFTYGKITDEELARIRERIGEWYQVPLRARYNETATRDTIRHFCNGIGDDNPLYRDQAYAVETRHGEIIAPPSFLYSCYIVSGGGGFPGVHGFMAGNDWEFFKTVRLGDSITVTLRYTDLVVKEKSEYAGRTAIPYREGFFWNQHGELVARALGWSVRAERKAAKEKGKYQQIKKYEYTPDELQAIEDAYDAEEIRGNAPRYWEDVAVGDALVPVVKGPLNHTDIQGFSAGCHGAATTGRGGAHKFGLAYKRRHPAWAYKDPVTGVVDTPERVHVSSTMSDEIAIPAAYDYGHQRLSWLFHVVTNWMGDDGFLKRFYGELRRFNLLGDTTWCQGNVIKKYEENGEHLVDIEIRAENQRGEVTAPGRVTVCLPSRSLDQVPRTGC